MPWIRQKCCLIRSVLAEQFLASQVEAVEGNVTGVVFTAATMTLVLEGKACTHDSFLEPKRNIDAGIPGSTFHPPGMQMVDTIISMPSLLRQLSACGVL